MPGRVRQKLLNDHPLTIAPWVGLLTLAALWPRRPKGAAPIPGPRRDLPGRSEGRIGDPEQLAALEPDRGRRADNPRQMPPLGWKDIAWRTWSEINEDRLPAVAGGITFYALLAIFPAIGAFCSLYGLFADVGTVQKQLAGLARVFPREVLQLIGDQMLRLTQAHEAKLSIAFVVSLALSIWSANAGISSLFDGLNIAYDETEKRSFVRRRGLTLSFTAGLLVFVAAASWLLIGLPDLLFKSGLGPFAYVWIPLRWLAILLAVIGVCAILYRYGPSRAPARWRWVRWGAVFSAFAWLLGSLGFSAYVNTLAHYDATYGPLGAVVAFMMWLWFSIMTILIGAELNSEIEHQTAVDSTTGAPLPMGLRGATMADTVGLPFHFSALAAWRAIGKRLTAALHPPSAAS